MTLLDDRVLADGRLLYGDIVDVHIFLTHRVDIALGMTIGTMFYREAGMGRNATMVLTAATSGIAPSIFAAVPLCVPLVFAHKEHGITMGEVYTADAPSPTKGGIITLHVSKDVIGPSDRVVIYDDFLSSAATILALVDICKQAGATVASIGVVIEKTWMNGRVRLESLGVPVYAACKVAINNRRLAIV